ncbi:MAG: type VI secretion system ImpA family N-terminal domain-containing protein [Holosporales bacterium]|jgi:type VI secretion system protein ImpA|nr:type VI secretion system ImpA family N-terminal domain-containing protein [Holosporales bacterium]
MNRINYSIEDVLKNIGDSPNVCGEDLSLSQIYDAIRDARFEEDERLSLGVWERDLKKADWVLVEKICIETLITKSKDLQIIGWLIEAITILDGFKGICRGIRILNEFIKIYWKDCYPKSKEDIADEEQKFKILDWIYETINKRAVSIPFINKNENSVSIYNYDYALEMKSISIRAPDQAKEILESAEKNNVKTLDIIQNILKTANRCSLGEIIENIEELELEKSELEKTISNVSANEEFTVFSKLIKNISKLKNLLTQYIVEDSENKTIEYKEKQGENIQEVRDNIYEQIKVLSEKLRKIEKHSPSYYMLDMVVSWQNKTLLEIIANLKSGTSEAHELFKLLLGS